MFTPLEAYTHKYNNLLICVHVNMPLVSFEMRGNRYHCYETISPAKALGRFVWAYPPVDGENLRQRESWSKWIVERKETQKRVN